MKSLTLYAVYPRRWALSRLLLPVPMGRRTPLSPELVDRDVDVSWWVTPEAYAEGYYAKLFQGSALLALVLVPLRQAALFERRDSQFLARRFRRCLM